MSFKQPSEPKSARDDTLHLPCDLLVASGLALLGGVLAINGQWNDSLLRTFLTLPFLLVVPGYGLVSLLYPRADHLSFIPRFALSVAFSVSLIPIAAFMIAASPIGLTREALVIVILVLSIVLLLFAYVRRLSARPLLDIESLSNSGVRPAFASLRSRTFPELVVGLLLAIVVLLPLIFLTNPISTEYYTEFYLSDSSGQIASPAFGLNNSTSTPVTLHLANHEQQSVNYSVLVLLENESMTNENGNAPVNLDILNIQIPMGGTEQTSYMVPGMEGRDARVDFLLFRDSVPVNMTTRSDLVNASYRHLFLLN